MDGKVVTARLAVFIAGLALTAGCSGQARSCPAQNWAGAGANVWAAEGSIKVMLNNQPGSNRPTIPTFLYEGKLDDGNFDPWGYAQHPKPLPQLNSVWSCKSGTPEITVAGAGRETVSFQVFITTGVGATAALDNVSVAVTPLHGPGTITSDNMGSSNVTRYLEGYVPYSNPPSKHNWTGLAGSGYMPDPLIPFYDPYDAGNPAVANRFKVQAGTTQGVWVDISIPANQPAGKYTGTVTVSGKGMASESIPLSLTVWNGNLPRFDSPNRPDMLKTFMPMYSSRFDPGEGMKCYISNDSPCPLEAALVQKYQVMGHAYFADTQMVRARAQRGEGFGPKITGAYPTAPNTATSFTVSGPGSQSTIDWTNYDAYVGPALTPGGLFADGTSMRVFATPLGNSGSGAWGWHGQGGYDWDFQHPGNIPVPAGLLQLYQNYATQISRHFAKNQLPVNQGGKGWGHPELIAYTFDEPYHNELANTVLIYQDIARFNQAINRANTSLSAAWDPATDPIRSLLSDMPACMRKQGRLLQEKPMNPNVKRPAAGKVVSYSDEVCADHMGLSYPKAYPESWTLDWSPSPVLYMPGQPGPPLFYEAKNIPAALTAGTGYKFTLDKKQGVPAMSTAPVPIETWFYQGHDPYSPDASIGQTGIGFRAWFWIAYKYGLDVTAASAGVPKPVVPAPGAVWTWSGNFWGGYNGNALASNCNPRNGGPSPYVSAATDGDGVWFYPGNELGCYASANAVGTHILSRSLAVNSDCKSKGYSVCNGISGPVASIRMEEWRRGYEDYEYMYLLGHKSSRQAALKVVNAMGGGGLKSWNALDWFNISPYWRLPGVWQHPDGSCTDSAAGLPNGPTGSGASGGSPCPGEWTNNPEHYAAARVRLAEYLGFAPSNTPK